MSDRIYPVDLPEKMAGADAQDAYRMVQAEVDEMMSGSTAKSRGCKVFNTINDEHDACERLIGWYKEARQELESIRRRGLVEWIAGHRTPMVWATLLGLKAQGITDLPL